jgi:hypothetical protein
MGKIRATTDRFRQGYEWGKMTLYNFAGHEYASLLTSNEPLKMDSNHSKQLDRMLRFMPTFNGKADENYDSYVIGVRQTLEIGMLMTVLKR